MFRHRLAWSLAIVALAGMLRFPGVTQVGIRFEDEAAYYDEARLWRRCAGVLADRATLAAVVRADKSAVKQRLQAAGVDFAAQYEKPCRGYTLLAAAMMTVVGERPAALPAMNALFGTLSVALLYALAVVAVNRRVAICAALLLACSPQHISYSRGGLTEAPTAFFVLLAVRAWVLARRNPPSPRRALFATGLALGAAVTCHYRAAYLAVVVMLVEAWFQGTKVSPAPLRRPEPDPVGHGHTARIAYAVQRALWVPVGIMVPLLAVEAVPAMAWVAARMTGGDSPLTTLTGALWRFTQSVRDQGVNASGGSFWTLSPQVAIAYAGYLAYWQGWVATILLLPGTIELMRRRHTAGVAWLLIASAVLLALQPFAVARAWGPLLPLLSFAVVLGLGRVLRWLCGLGRVRFVDTLRLAAEGRTRVPGALAGDRSRGSLRYVLRATLPLTAAICLSSSPGTYRVLTTRSAIPGAASWLAARGGRAVAAEDPRKYAVYLDGTAAEVVGGRRYRASVPPVEALAALRRDGVRWVIADPQRWHYRDPESPGGQRVFDWWQELEELLQRRGRPAVEFPHLTDCRWEFLSEGSGLAYLSDMIQRGDGGLRVYELEAPDPPVVDNTPSGVVSKARTGD